MFPAKLFFVLLRVMYWSRKDHITALICTVPTYVFMSDQALQAQDARLTLHARMETHAQVEFGVDDVEETGTPAPLRRQYLRRPPHDLVELAVEMVARLLRLPTSSSDECGGLFGSFDARRVRRRVA